ALKARTETLRLNGPMYGLVETACGVLGDRDAAQKQRLLRIEWREPYGRLAVLDRFAMEARERKAATEMRACRRGIRIELNRPAESRNRFVRVALHHGPISERNMGPRISIVERERADGMLAAWEQALVARNPSHVRRIDEAESEQALRRCVVRPNVRELLEQRDCRRRIRLGDPGKERAGPHHEIPGP